MNYKLLNDMINYIEDNLDGEIDNKKLSKIVGVNDYSLQRIFVFLTGISISEYIKKRKLSKAFEDIKNSNDKIIDISAKYGYNSATAFNRAFKKLFNITPTECRNTKIHKSIPIIHFEENMIDSNSNFYYEISTVKDTVIYCYHLISDDYHNLHYKIRQLYSEINETGEHSKYKKVGLYGIYLEKDNKFHYLLGTSIYNKGLEKYEINSGKYAVFKIENVNQKNIVSLQEKIYKEWFKSTNYKIGKNDTFEYYDEKYCYIYASID